MKAMVQDGEELSEADERRAGDTEAYTLASLMLLLSDGEGESRREVLDVIETLRERRLRGFERGEY